MIRFIYNNISKTKQYTFVAGITSYVLTACFNLLAKNEGKTLPNYRTETKNINSIRALGRAIEFEIVRQSALLKDGIRPTQETRGWKDDKNMSVSQRSKEDAMDYRYVPEPDLPILEILPSELPSLSDLPILPNIQRQKYLDLGLNLQTANTLVSQTEVGNYFEQVLSLLE